MAISIDSTSRLNLIDAAESTTGWTFSGITKTALSTIRREGTNSIGGQMAASSFGYAWHTHGSSVNMTTAGNERVYVWAQCPGVGTFAEEGWMVLIGDGTNRRAYRVGGSDDVPFSVNGWVCLMLDTANLPTTFQQVAGGAPTLTAITQFGVGIYNTAAPSGNALNVWVDVVRYGSGLIITSGATDDISLADIAADDASAATGKAYGIIREIQPGVYGVQGDILFGNTAGGSIDWKETDAVVIFEDRVRGSGTNTKFQMSGQHSATGAFRAELGIAVSSGDNEAGRSGVTFISANPASQPVDFNFSDSDIEDVFLYGCTFTNLRGGTIAFSSDATNGISHHVSGCVFSGSGQVDPGRAVFRNCQFAATGDVDAALLWNENIDLKRSQFLGNTTGAAIEHPGSAGSPYDYFDLTFSGNTFDGLNTSGSDITVNNNGTSNAANDEGANTITYLSSATLTMIVTDEDGDPIVGALAYIDDNNVTQFIMNTTTNGSGIASVGHTAGAVAGATWRVRKYGFKQFRQVIDIPASGTKEIPVTLVVDPQQT